MPKIPAICLNPKCGAIFPSPLNLKNTNFVTSNMSYGPCPKCGSDGKIPDGRYDAFGDSLFAFLENISDASVIKKAVEAIKKHLAAGESPARIIEQARNEAPEMQSLWNLIPQTRAEAYAFIMLLITLLTLIVPRLQALKSNDQKSIIKQEIINQTFQNFYSQDNSVNVYIQQDSHNENMKTKKGELRAQDK